MRRAGYLSFVLVSLVGLGCHITDYPVITDSEGDSQGFMVNTNGKALLTYAPESQVITLWPDQNEELFSMVDQKANGDQVISSYTNVSYGDPKFVGNIYCNPDWTGCAFEVSQNPNDPGDDPFSVDFFNYSCRGIRSECVWVAYDERLGECGRGLFDRSPVEAIADWMASMTTLADGSHAIRAHRRNLQLTGIAQDGGRHRLPIFGAHEARLVPGKGLVLEYQPNVGPTALAAVRLTEELGIEKWEISYLGHAVTFHARVAEHLAERVQAY